MSARPEPGAIAERVLRGLHRRYPKTGQTSAELDLAIEDLRALRATVERPDVRAAILQSAQAQARQGIP